MAVGGRLWAVGRDFSIADWGTGGSDADGPATFNSQLET